MIDFPLSAIGTSAQWFQLRLREQGIALRRDMELARGLAKLEDFRVKATRGFLFKFKTYSETFSYFWDATSVDALTKAIHWGHVRGFRLPRDRWWMLCKGDPNVFRAGTPSRDWHLTWETLIASLVATFAREVQFGEPDVLCQFEGKAFSVAAKVCNSVDNVTENVLKGFEQSRGRADAGLVFLDVVALYPQMEEFGLSGRRKYTRDQNVVDMMKAAVTRWCDANFNIEAWTVEARKMLACPVGVAFFVPLLLEVDKHPVPMLYTHMPLCWGDQGPDTAFTTAFVRACDRLLGFQEEACIARDGPDLRAGGTDP